MVNQSAINSILIPILDICPKHTLLVSFSEIDKDVKPIAKQYGIHIISNSDIVEIINAMEEFLCQNYSKNGEK